MTSIEPHDGARTASHAPRHSPSRAHRHDRSQDQVGARVGRLSAAAAKRIIEPDADVPGHVGDGQVLPDELLTVAGLGLDLSAEDRITLSREETASIVQAGVIFEAVLEAGLAFEITRSRDLTDPRITFLLHEIGEETRHQRLFIRVLSDLDPQAPMVLDNPVVRFVERFGMALFTQRPAMLYTLILGGEEIPDLFQKLASEHPDTDPFIKAVNRYHRQEEARHLSFARAVLPEVWAEANLFDRFLVKRVAPRIIRGMFDMLVQPGVYQTIGLPGWKTWDAARRTDKRVAIRQEATRPVLAALISAGAIKPGQVNRLWRSLCGVDRFGSPATAG